MKRLLLLLSIALICSSAIAWDLVRQASFPINFFALETAGTHLWAGGSSGGVGKSIDGGQSWSFVETPFFNAATSTYRTIEDISFATEENGVIVGGSGIVAITADGGNTWAYPATAQAVIGTTELKSAVYHSDGKIWVCGSSGMIAYSPDHGATWSLQTAGISTILYGMSMNEDGVGFIACNKGTPSVTKILKTNNYGSTWTIENFTVGDNPSIYNVRQFGAKVILVGDYGYLGYSDDNGATWTHHSYAAGTTSNDELHDVVMIGDTGFAVGWNHCLLKTTDGWASFEAVPNDFSSHHLEQVVQNTAGNLVAAGWLGVISISSNDAVSWVDPIPNAIDYYQASIVDANTWFIAGDKGNVLKTTDGGQTLEKKNIPGFLDVLSACYFKNANEGWVSGKTIGDIYHTTDGGNTWEVTTIPGFSSARSYFEFFFVSDLVGYVVGVGGKVAKTTDGGITWVLTGDNIPSTQVLFCTYWKSATTGYAGSGGGLLYVTTDGGLTWTSLTVGTSANIRDIWFKDENNGVLVKANGQVFYTTTGGNTAGSWIAATEGANSEVNGVFCDNQGIWWAAGYSNEAPQMGNTWALMKSIDNGVTWTEESFPALTFNPTRFMGIGSRSGNMVAIGKNNLIVTQMSAPEHVVLNTPANDSTNIDPANTLLSWIPSATGSPAMIYQVFLSETEEGIFDGYLFETAATSLDLSAAMIAVGASLGFETRWYWAVLPVDANLVSPDPAVGDFMIWHFTTMSDPALPLETPILNIERVNNSVMIYWQAVPNAQSYILMGATDPEATYTQITATPATQWVISNPGQMEFFKVIASSDPVTP